MSNAYFSAANVVVDSTSMSNTQSNKGGSPMQFVSKATLIEKSIATTLTLDEVEGVFKSVRALLGVGKSGIHVTIVRQPEELRVFFGTECYTFTSNLVVDTNGHVYRGMALISSKKGVPTGITFLNAYASFARQFLAALVEALRTNADYKYIADNIAADVNARLNKLEWSSKTSDSYDSIDGGSQHVLVNSFVPVAVNGSGFYSKAGNSLVIGAIPMAHERGYAHAFNKNVFLTGTLCHVYPDSSIKSYLAQLGIEVAVESDVINVSSKKQKGTKRVLLPMAQVAQVRNAKSAGYKLVDQERCIEGHLVTAAFFPTVAFPPGMSAWTGPVENKPVGIITSNQRGFEVEARNVKPADVLGLVSFDELGVTPTVTKDGNGFVATFPSTYVQKGDVIAECLGSIMVASFTGKLVEVRWQLTTSMANTQRVAISAKYIREERDMKGRSICKAQFITTAPEMIINSLNEGVVTERPDVVHFMDAIKADTVYSWLIPAATTAIHSGDVAAIDMIRRINFAVEGRAHSEYLRIDPAWVLRGVYDEFLSHFRNKYGRACWLQFPVSGDFTWMMEGLYVNNTPAEWRKCKVEGVTFSTKLPNIEVICLTDAEETVDPNIDMKANVLAFVYSNGQLVAHFQRGYGFVGCYNVEGFELASVQQCVGSTTQLPNNIRSIERIQVTDAANMRAEIDDMMSNGHKRRVLIRALHLMNAGALSFGSWVSDLRTVEGAAHVRELLLGKIGDVSKSDLFKVFAAATQDYTFKVSDEKSLWLPAIYAVNKAASDSDAGMSISGVIREFFMYILTAESFDVAVLSQYCRRVIGLLGAILSPSSESSWKFQGGREAAAAKRVAHPQCPIGEIWVLKSDHPNSCYQEFRANGLFNNSTAIGSRMPMADGHVGRVRVLSAEENTAMFYQLSEFQIGISPLACLIDKGDFDGDGEFAAKLNGEWELTTRESVMAHFKMTTGSDLFDVDCDAYARDHYGIKRFSAIQFGVVKKCVMSRSDHAEGQQKAFEVQSQMVGGMFTLWQLTDLSEHLLNGLRKAGVPTPARQAWAEKSGTETVGIMAEQYEVPLGGYSDAAYSLWLLVKDIQPNTKENMHLIKPADLPQLGDALASMGAYQGSDARQRIEPVVMNFASAVNTVATYRYLAALVAENRVDEARDIASARYPDMNVGLTLFLACASHVLFESARGKDAGFRFVDGLSAAGRTDYGQVLSYVMRFHQENKTEDWYQLWLDNCSGLRLLIQHMLRDLAPALSGSQALGLRNEERELFTKCFKGGASQEVIEEAEEAKEEVMVAVSEKPVTEFVPFLNVISSAPAAEAIAEEVEEIESVQVVETLNFEDDGFDMPINEIVDEVVAEEVAPADVPSLLTKVARVESPVRKPSVGRAVVVFPAMMKDGQIIPCSNNLPVNVTGDYAQPIRSFGDPNYAQFGLSSHTHGMDCFNMSPIAFVAGRLHIEGKRWLTTARVFDNNGQEVQLHRHVVAMVDHDGIDATDPSAKGAAAIEHCCAREALMIGGEESDSYKVESTGVANILADGQRHWFVAIADVNLIDEKCGKGHTQSRVRMGAVNIYHISEGAFDRGFPPELKAINLINL